MPGSVPRSVPFADVTLPAALPEPVLADVEVDGAVERIATWVLEPADRAPAADVVLCHGTPWSARVWAPVARALSREYRVFLWDMPGYGASAKDAGTPVDLVAQRRRLAALLRHWSLDGSRDGSGEGSQDRPAGLS